MKTYVIRYKSWGDPASPVFSLTVRQHDAESAELAFVDSMDGDSDWEIVSVARKRGQHAED